ncbi:MAG: hypothetical protein WD887_02675 [Candidatus Saccharimonadales bacterium]
MSAFTVLAPRSIIKSVNNSKHALRLPASVSAGSFLVLLLLMVLTSPIKNIAYAVLFFGTLLVFLLSSLALLIRFQIGSLSRLNRYRIIILSVAILIMIMFRSAQSLNWVDGFVLVIATVGLLFYVGRR